MEVPNTERRILIVVDTEANLILLAQRLIPLC